MCFTHTHENRPLFSPPDGPAAGDDAMACRRRSSAPARSGRAQDRLLPARRARAHLKRITNQSPGLADHTHRQHRKINQMSSSTARKQLWPWGTGHAAARCRHPKDHTEAPATTFRFQLGRAWLLGAGGRGGSLASTPTWPARQAMAAKRRCQQWHASMSGTLHSCEHSDSTSNRRISLTQHDNNPLVVPILLSSPRSYPRQTPHGNSF